MLASGYKLTKTLDFAFNGSVTIPRPERAKLPVRHWKLRLEAYMHEICHGAVLGWYRAPRKYQNRLKDFEMMSVEIEHALWDRGLHTANLHEVKTVASVIYLGQRHGWGIPEEHSIDVGRDSLFEGDHDTYKVVTPEELQAMVRAVPVRLLERYARRAEAITANMVEGVERVRRAGKSAARKSA